jgi:hypothetical protein
MPDHPNNLPRTESVYQVVRELDGTITRRLAQPEYDDTPFPSFGFMTDWYLQSHGFSTRAVLHIAHAHDTAQVATDFVDYLSQRGLSACEAFFLWGLIAGDVAIPQTSS